jgi:hypothetical protein
LPRCAFYDRRSLIEFGCFRLLPHRREVLAEGRPLELGESAFARRAKRCPARPIATSNQATALSAG